MKYWIFQNNQVLGPYEPDEMGKISVFSPESLVCPEGRRGTSMGDWQRAGMVPDLSVALVRANSSSGGKTAVLSIAGLPPEPTLKDLAQLGSIQEKVALLEEVVVQLQEGLRAKDVELTSLHQELAGKSSEASEIKGEAAARQREADELKRQIAGLEDRLSSVRLLSETLDKAVAEEKRVEQDVEKQGQTITDLARDVEDLRRQLAESKSRQVDVTPSVPMEPPLPHPLPIASPMQMDPPMAAPVSMDPPPAFANFTPPAPEPVVEAAAPIPMPAEPTPAPYPAAPMEFPTVNAEPLPSFESAMPPLPGAATLQTGAQTQTSSFDPMSFGDPSSGALAPEPTTAAPAEPEPFGVVPAPAPKSRKGLLIGAVAGLAALGGLAVMGGFVPGLRKPQAPASVVEPTLLPPPEPLPPPVATPDSRQLAVEFAKAWPLKGGRTLESALEALAPSAGNLSPWMAEALAGSRVQVNYFARGSSLGTPTIAYEFEVDLDGKTLVGRNAAAKSVLTGKAAAPPAPPKQKPTRIKPKVEVTPEEDTLDSMLGDAPTKPAPAKPASAKPTPAKTAEVPDAMPGYDQGTTLTDTGDAPPAAEEPRPARANPARRAAKAKGGKAPVKDAPADETLLDDLLKE